MQNFARVQAGSCPLGVFIIFECFIEMFIDCHIFWGVDAEDRGECALIETIVRFLVGFSSFGDFHNMSYMFSFFEEFE